MQSFPEGMPLQALNVAAADRVLRVSRYAQHGNSGESSIPIRLVRAVRAGETRPREGGSVRVF